MSADRAKRIVVALEPSVHSRAALDAAADMAARLQAELVGIYVEDIDLLNVAALPFTQEFTVSASGGRALDTQKMLRALRGQASRLRKAIEAAALARRVPWSFRVARGRVAGELLAACTETDVLVVGKAGRPLPRAGRVGSNTLTLIRRSLGTVVVLQAGERFERPVMVVFDASEAGGRALRTAAGLATEDGGKILVALAAGSEAEQRLLRERAGAVLAEAGLEPTYVVLPSAGAEDLVNAVERAGCRTLVLAAESPLLGPGEPAGLLALARCPVVLVR
jgi:nucleotide-binding universal stress UspA family protein